MKIWQRTRIVVGWVLQILMAVAFVAIGIGKFRSAFWVRSFAHWGYPDEFRVVIGLVEAAGGVMLLVPRLTSYAALALGAVMVGASVTHAVWGEMWIRPLPHLGVLLALAWLRWPQRWRRARAGVATAQAAHS